MSHASGDLLDETFSSSGPVVAGSPVLPT